MIARRAARYRAAGRATRPSVRRVSVHAFTPGMPCRKMPPPLRCFNTAHAGRTGDSNRHRHRLRRGEYNQNIIGAFMARLIDPEVAEE